MIRRKIGSEFYPMADPEEMCRNMIEKSPSYLCFAFPYAFAVEPNLADGYRTHTKKLGILECRIFRKN